MKIRITFKDPDSVTDSICEAASAHARVWAQARCGVFHLQDLHAERNTYFEQVNDKLQRWIRHSEYLTVEFDLETGTATVQEQKP